MHSIKRSFASAVEQSGLTDFTFHDLRHTCAAWLVQAGVPLRTAAEILRHKDIRTTMRYAHLAPENLHSAVDTLRDRIVTTNSENQQFAANSCKKVTQKH